MTTPEFDEFYQRLNPEQRRAVDTIEGPVMVIAGPGTGKTQILTLRIANILLKTDVNPFNILALTFTESAVAAMRKRLVAIIGEAGYRVHIYTFHSFCNEVIKDNPESFPHLISSVNITELEQIEALQEIVLNGSFKVLKPFGDSLYYIRPLLSTINDLKKEGVTPEKLKQAVKHQKEDYDRADDLYYEKGPNKGKKKGKYLALEREIEKNSELAQVYAKFQQLLVERKFYDYNDMILEVVVALQKNEDLLLRLQEQHQYLLVDEHQDTNAAQNKIIELLGNFYDNPNLFVVGDEKQAIFRFQGASLENFLYFKKLYPEAILINLSFNYRSTQTVLDASGSLIAKNILPESTRINRVALLAKMGHPEEKVRVVRVEATPDEYRFLTLDIKQKLDSGISPQEIAVIYRNNKDALPIIESFEQHSIPFFVESDQDLLSDLDIKKFLGLLLAVENFGEDVYLVPILHLKFLGIDPLDTFKLIKFSQRQNLPLYELLSNPAKAQDLELTSSESLKNLYNLLIKWKKLQHDDCLENLYISILRDSGMLQLILSRPDVHEILDKFAGLYNEMKLQCLRKDNYSLTDFLNYLALLQQHRILISRPHSTAALKSVRLMTAHKSKGQEFEYVYIVNANDKHWGNKKRSEVFKIPRGFLDVKNSAEAVEDLNEDERRLFYVAMTRAKKQITISYAKTSQEGRELIPSLFVEEIDPQFKQEIDWQGENQTATTDVLTPDISLFTPRVPVGNGLKDKSFFQFLFESEGLSVSGLNNYLKCPRRYFYENLIHIPSFKDKQQIFGTAIHSTICGFQNLYQSSLKSQLAEKIHQILVEMFDKELQGQPLSRLDYQELKDKGHELLINYTNFYSPTWNREVLCEFEIKGVYLTPKVKINGRIDRIEKIPNSREVLIYDLKTGKPKTRGVIEGTTASSTGNYLRQLYFYKLLLDHYDNGRMQAKYGIVDFIEPDAKGNFHWEQFEYDPNQLKVLQDQIMYVAEQIRNLSFWGEGCNEPDCEYCNLRSFLTD